MPGVAPLAPICFKLRRIGGCDLVCGCGQSFTFTCILPLPAHRTFRFVVHYKPFGNLCLASPSQLRLRLLRSARGITIICYYKPISKRLTETFIGS